MKFLSVNGLNKALLLTIASGLLLALPGVAPAKTITVTTDGILTAGEYTGTNSGTESLLWWNGHESIYTKVAGNTNSLHWEINSNSPDANFSLNLFFEVPAYARRMIWNDDADYNGSNFESSWGIPIEYLDAYLDGTHHGSVKMDYKTQTESEYFQLNNGPTNLVHIGWQDEDPNGLGDGFTWSTSREYIIANGLGNETESLQFNMTASIELMWDDFDSEEAAEEYIASITDMELHLSDEAVGGLPLIPVPVPVPVPEPGSSLLLFGIGIGLVGVATYRRRLAS